MRRSGASSGSGAVAHEFAAWDEADALAALLHAGVRDGAAVLKVCAADAWQRPDLRTLRSARWELALADWEAVLGPRGAGAVAASLRAEVRDALALRENLVGLKKVYLHVMQGCAVVDRALLQLSTAFYVDGKDWCSDLGGAVTALQAPTQASTQTPTQTLTLAPTLAPTQASAWRRVYFESAFALQRCKGLASGLQIAREFVKRLCCVPRHPWEPLSASLRGAPYSFEIYGLLRELRIQYQATLAGDARWVQADLSAPPVSPADKTTPGTGLVATAATDTPEAAVALPPTAPASAKSETAAAVTVMAPAPVSSRQDDTDIVAVALPPDVSKSALGAGSAALEDAVARFAAANPSADVGTVSFIRRVLIARGLAKALRIRVETERLLSALGQCCSTIGGMLAAAEQAQEAPEGTPGANECGALLRPVALLGAALQTLEELRTWLTTLLREPNKVFFAAGDLGGQRCSGPGSGVVFPEGFGPGSAEQLETLRAVAERHRPLLRERLRAGDGNMHGKQVCMHCRASFSRAFVSHLNQLCLFCEDEARAQAGAVSEGAEDLVSCPLAVRCGSHASMCPHSLRCFLCDLWSCEKCGIVRADGRQTLAIVTEEQPALLLLDFDRTLASTKNGADPLARACRGRRSRHIGQEPAHEHQERGQGDQDQTGALVDQVAELAHSIDSSLRSAAGAVATAHVVTRNRHREQIVRFLSLHGLARLDVHIVARGETKADVIRRLLPALGSASEVTEGALFVDDSPGEVLDAEMRKLVRERCGTLRTVLFSRG